MRVVNLGSGSKGNCTFVECGGHRILVDVGFSYREISSRLSQIDVEISSIDTVLITHEHIDHVRGLMQMIKNGKQVYIEENCARVLGITNKLNVHTLSGNEFTIDDIIITPFYLSHDSIACLGYRIAYKNAKVGFMTDTGIVPGDAISILGKCKLVFIESNHDEQKLMGCGYPYLVKKRIISDIGHLSNMQCGKAMLQLQYLGVKHFVLSHISENSNTKELACQTVADILTNSGLVIGDDIVVRLTRQDEKSNNFIIGE